MAGKPILYSFYTSSAAWRVRAALAMKNIAYETRAVNLQGGDNMTEDYRKVNPAQQIPSLIIDGVTLVQSLPIIEYLEDTRPEPSVFPKDAKKRAQARGIAEMVNSNIHTLQSRRVGTVLAEYGVDPARTEEWKKYWVGRGLQTIEEMLQTTSGRFCVGDEISVADFFLVPQFKNLDKFNMDGQKYPVCQRIYNTCLEQEVFIQSAPENQPEAPQK